MSKTGSKRVLVAFRTGLLGADLSKSKTGQTVLATDGANTYALCHVQDTPLTLADHGTDWQGLTGLLIHNQVQIAIRSLSFHIQDPAGGVHAADEDGSRPARLQGLSDFVGPVQVPGRGAGRAPRRGITASAASRLI